MILTKNSLLPTTLVILWNNESEARAIFAIWLCIVTAILEAPILGLWSLFAPFSWWIAVPMFLAAVFVALFFFPFALAMADAWKNEHEKETDR